VIIDGGTFVPEPSVQFRFEDYVLDSDRRELRRGSDLIALEPQVFDLLIHLIQNRNRVASKDDLIAAVWGGRIVSDSTLTSRINAVRKAVGDSGREQRLIRTIARKGVRFIGAVDEPDRHVSKIESRPGAPHLRQDVQFCTVSDGTRIAYATVGRGPPLVKTANWLNHLEYDWESPIWSHLLHALAANYRLIRFDARGNGLSDWAVDDISFDAFVCDLETVVEATGLDRFSLLGISQGCATSIAYVVRNPDRVTHLVLYGGFARGMRKRGSASEIQQADALHTLMRHGWGQENPALRQMFTTRFLPGGSAEQMKWFNDLQRITASPENAVRIRLAVENVDVTDLLPKVRVPTLVLHCRGDAVQPFDEGRRMAAGIPGAHFVALEGDNHLVLEGDPAWSHLLDEINSFLAS
jgi:pimeloyl-ACP methyl ester carboxylesterase/DNA-binding winged helix-turn-helix (wHTH) protein